MKKMVLSAAIAALGLLAAPAPGSCGEESKYELRTPAATIRDVLAEQAGKRVLLRIENGESIEGTVTKVGDTVVHVAKLSGREFYDAVVRIDRISAVVFRVRAN